MRIKCSIVYLVMKERFVDVIIVAPRVEESPSLFYRLSNNSAFGSILLLLASLVQVLSLTNGSLQIK